MTAPIRKDQYPMTEQPITYEKCVGGSLHDRAAQHLTNLCIDPGATPGPGIDPETVALIAALAGNPRTVAGNLERHGCVGLPGQGARCPVAVYLMRSDLGLHHVAVDDDIAFLFTGDAGEDYTSVTLPVAVRGFIGEYDDGGFPQLRAEAATR